jgi:ribonuclease HI
MTSVYNVNTLKVCQINLGKRTLANLNLMKYIAQHDLDICLIQEPSILKTRKIDYVPCGYDFFIPTSRLVPRVAIITKKCLGFLRISALDERDSVTVQSYLGTSQCIRFSSVYMDCGLNDPSTLLLNLKAICNFSIPHFIGTDSNSWHSLWGGKPGSRGNEKQFERGECIVDAMLELKLSCVNPTTYKPTFVNASGFHSAIDLTLSNNDDMISDWSITDRQLESDHFLITFSVEITGVLQQRKLFNIRKVDWSEAIELLSMKIKNLPFNIWFCSVPNDVDDKILLLSSMILDTMINIAPVSQRFCYKSPVPWWSKDIDKQQKLVKSLRRNYYRNKCMAVRRELTNQRRILKKMVHEAKKEKMEQDLNECDDPNDLIKRFSKKYSIGQCAVDGVLVDNAQFLLDNLLGHDSCDEAVHAEMRAVCDMSLADMVDTIGELSDNVMENRIKRCIGEMNKKGAAGADGISTFMIYKLLGVLIYPLVQLYKSCYRLCYFPQCWKKGKLCVIEKDGKDPTTVSGLRPLTLLSCLSKLFEKVIAADIRHHLNDQGLLRDGMHGYRKHRSTDTLTFELTNYIENEMLKGNYVVLVQYDLSKAFDGLSHVTIIFLLIFMKFPPFLIMLVVSYLKDRSVECMFGGTYAVAPCVCGVPQGSVLGPLIFSIYCCYLYILLDGHFIAGEFSYKLLNFADDNTLVVSSKRLSTSVESADNITKIIIEWASAGKLSLSAPKTKSMLFTKNLSYDVIYPSVNGQQIIYSPLNRILGVWYHEKLCWYEHIKKRCESTRRYLFKISMILSRVYGAKSYCILRLLPQILNSMIFYCICSWCGALSVKKNVALIDNMIQKFYKSAAKLSKSTSGFLAQLMCGVPSALDVAKNLVMRRVLHGPFPSLHTISLKPLKSSCERFLFNACVEAGIPINAEFERKCEINENLPLPVISFEEKQVAIQNASLDVPGCLKVYADGSKNNERCRSAVICAIDDSIISERLICLSNTATVVETEVAAIAFGVSESLKLLMSATVTFSCIIIYSDSKLAVLSLMSQSSLLFKLDFYQNLEVLRNLCISLSFHWSPARSGIASQIRADELSKAVNRQHDYTFDVPISLKHTRQKCDELMDRNCKIVCENVSRFVGSVPASFLPNAQHLQKVQQLLRNGQLSYQLSSALSGHCLAFHRKRIDRNASDRCPCGEAAETVRHVLIECSLLSNLRDSSWPLELYDFTKDMISLEALQRFVVASKRFGFVRME